MVVFQSLLRNISLRCKTMCKLSFVTTGIFSMFTISFQSIGVTSGTHDIWLLNEWMSLPVFQLASRHANYILMLLFQVRQHSIHKWSSAVFGTVRIHSARGWFKACLKNVLSCLSNHTISLPQYSICPVPTIPSHRWLGSLEHHTVQLQMPCTHENEHHAHKFFLFSIFNVT